MPSSHTALEYANVRLIYGESRCNVMQADYIVGYIRMLNIRYPNYRVLMNICQAESEVCLPSDRRNTGRPTWDNDEEVLQEIKIDASILVRAIEENTGVPKSSAHRIRSRFQPYYVQRVQSL